MSTRQSSEPTGATRLLGAAWRGDLATTIRNARASVLLAAPFIKYDVAAWLREQIPAGVALTLLTRIRADAIASAALDVTALLHLAETSESARIVALPNLHAKVFVADGEAAIVTSGNLTRSGLDTNIEYGVLLRESRLVATVRDHMRSFARLGSQVSSGMLAELVPLEEELRRAHAQSATAVAPEARKRLAGIMSRAKPRLALAQVGDRSANAVFGEAVRFALTGGPKTTEQLGPEVAALLPDLCDDAEELVINGERYGKAWKHSLRNAQQHLKRRGVVVYDPDARLWALSAPPLTPPTSPSPPPPSSAPESP